MSVLTADRVHDLASDCLPEDEITDPNEYIEIDGIMHVFRFDRHEIEARRSEIGELLLELPYSFRKSEAGGWSFLSACDDRHGTQWTGEHRMVELLFVLGQAAGYVELLTPRDMWSILPGGMPYYAVLDDLIE